MQLLLAVHGKTGMRDVLTWVGFSRRTGPGRQACGNREFAKLWQQPGRTDHSSLLVTFMFQQRLLEWCNKQLQSSTANLQHAVLEF
jgi:hypothetical protein